MSYREITSEIVARLSPTKVYPSLPKEANYVGTVMTSLNADEDILVGVNNICDTTREYFEFDTYDTTNLGARQTANDIYYSLSSWDNNVVCKRVSYRSNPLGIKVETTGQVIYRVTQEFKIAYKNTIELP